MEKRLIAALSLSLAAALLVIAFLVGRMTRSSGGGPSLQPPAVRQPETQRVPASPPVRPAEQSALTVPVMHPPLPEDIASVREAPVPAFETPTPLTSHDLGAKSVIESYFAKMDAIHVEGSGDPSAFAQEILAGLERGDMSGIDSLVAGAKAVLAQAAAVQPPLPCADYHRRLIQALSEAAVEMASVRDAIKTSDVDAIAAIASHLQTTQQKIGDLEQLKKQLLAQ